MQGIQHLGAIAEIGVSAFVHPDVMRDVVDDIDTILEWYHLIAYLGYYFSIPSFNLESVKLFISSV